MAKAGVEEGNKDLQLNVVDALKKKEKKKNHSFQKINEAGCPLHCVYECEAKDEWKQESEEKV